MFQETFNLVVIALCDKSQEGRLISKYQTAVQTDAELVISSGDFPDAGTAMGMRIAKVKLGVADCQTDGPALTSWLASDCGKQLLIDLCGFQSKEAGSNGPSNLVVNPFLRSSRFFLS